MALPSFRYRLEQQVPHVGNGGVTRGASVREFPISTGIAGVSMRLAPGTMRELHWHANAAESGLRRRRLLPHHNPPSRRISLYRHVQCRRAKSPAGRPLRSQVSRISSAAPPSSPAAATPRA